MGDRVILFTSGSVGSAPVFPWPLSTVYTHRTKKVRELFMRVAKEKNIAYVDLFKEKRDDPFLKDIQRFYCPDMLHLTADGYRVWYDQLKIALDAKEPLG